MDGKCSATVSRTVFSAWANVDWCISLNAAWDLLLSQATKTRCFPYSPKWFSDCLIMFD